MSATMKVEGEKSLERIGGYEIVSLLAAGGMAHVYLARHLPDGAEVAIKVIRPELGRNPDFIAMFVDESTIAATLSHPNIVSLREVGRDGDRSFLVMERLHGRPLLQVWEACLKRGMRLPFDVCAWIGARIADALHYAHELRDEQGALRDVVHRDVNPSNVFLTRDGVPKLIDFGLARAKGRVASTAVGIVKGKLAYVSPEQVQGEAADRRADVFALGVTLWELTVGRRLFKEDDDADTLRRVLAANVPDPRTIVDGYPPKLAETVMKALAKDPALRFATAHEMARALDASAGNAPADVMAATVAKIVATVTPFEGSPGVPPPLPSRPPSRHSRQPSRPTSVPWSPAPMDLAHRLEGRLRSLAGSDDVLARARAHVELALLDETLGDGAKAATHALAALACDRTMTAAHSILRRARTAQADRRAVLPHLDAEIAAATRDDDRASLHAARARVLAAAGDDRTAVRAAFQRALEIDPVYPAALFGLDATFAVADDANTRAYRAAHLARMADAFAGEAKLAAWLHVERAHLLDEGLGQLDAARDALVRALELDAGLGPVRDACVAFATAHRDAPSLVTLLSDEAELTRDSATAAALEVDAASIARYRLGDAPRATALLQRAVARSGVSPVVLAHAHDALVALAAQNEGAGDARASFAAERDARRARLAFQLEGAASPRTRAHELVRVANLSSRMGDTDGAIEALVAARSQTPDDTSLLEAHDALLAAGTGASTNAKTRVALWAAEAARLTDVPSRVRALLRAARIAEGAGLVEDAAAQLRGVLTLRPADAEAIDGLSRLLVHGPTDAELADVRTRVVLYTRAAAAESEPVRRIAYLERAALVWEELALDAGLAAGVYEEILALEPGRRSAVLGLARTAARAGDAPRLARALLDEATATKDAAARAALELRAAIALAPSAHERAVALVAAILTKNPADDEARAFQIELLTRAGLWADVDTALATRIANTKDASARVALHLLRAEILATRLGAKGEAADALRAARALDATHPVPPEALVELAEARTPADPAALRDSLVELGGVRFRLRAAEIEELVLLDDAAASASYEAALAALGGGGGGGGKTDPWIARRLARVKHRLARASGKAPRSTMAPPPASDFVTETARLAALWREADALERGAPNAHAIANTGETDVYARILALRPNDRAALDALLRRSLVKLRGGEVAALAPVTMALTQLVANASPLAASTCLALHLALAHVQTRARAESDGGLNVNSARSSLASYREALRIDARSISAAFGTLGLATALDDVDAAIDSGIAAAELEPDPHARARLLSGAASRLATARDSQPDSGRASARDDLRARTDRAATLLDEALGYDPENIAAVTLLVSLRAQDGARAKLVHTLRAALAGAKQSEAVVLIGWELAQAARGAREDAPFAIDALTRVREVAPSHVPSLEMLATLYVDAGALPEARDALEAVAEHATEPLMKHRALLEIAELHRRIGENAPSAAVHDAVERALRRALLLVPDDATTLERLIAALRAREGEGSVDARVATRREIGDLLARLARAVESGPRRSELFVELAAVRTSLGERAEAGAALVEAVAEDPRAPLREKLATFYAGDPKEHARALEAVVARAEALGRPDPSTFAELGRLELETGDVAGAASHLRVALTLAPQLHETRALLARALAKSGATADAGDLILGMVTPDASPLLSLRDVGASLEVLEAGLRAKNLPAEARVVRELRAVGGTLDDSSHVALRAQRLSLVDATAGLDVGALDRSILMRAVVPPEGRHVLLDVAAALGGVESKLFPAELDAVGVTSRDRVGPGNRHPLRLVFDRLLRLLGLEAVELAVSEQVGYPRVVAQPVPWLVAPAALAHLPEPVQTAALARPLTRIALGVPWLEDLPLEHAHALLVAAARKVSTGFAEPSLDASLDAKVDEYDKPLARALGRKEKKALSLLEPRLDAAGRAPALKTTQQVAAIARAVSQAEVRVAFLVTGDLLATLDELRALDPALAAATSSAGASALAATLGHPLAGDVCRFALSHDATALRRRAVTLFGHD